MRAQSILEVMAKLTCVIICLLRHMRLTSFCAAIGQTSRSDAKSIEAKFRDSFLSTRREWTHMYHQLTFLQRGRLTLRTNLSVPTSTVSQLLYMNCTKHKLILECVDFIMVLDDLEHFSRETDDAAALASVETARAAIEKLVIKMDGLESGFDRIAERSRTYLLLLLLQSRD